jgi:hypothetical protein
MLQVKLWVVVVVVPAVVSVVSVVSVVGLAGFGRVADRCSVRGVGAAWLNGWRPFLRLWPRTPNWSPAKVQPTVLASGQLIVKIGAISEPSRICYGTPR